MPSAIAKKTAKSTSAFTWPIKAKAKIVRASKGKLTAAKFDEIVKRHGGRSMSVEERREFRRFAKDPYP
jgi:hypothetical protein